MRFLRIPLLLLVLLSLAAALKLFNRNVVTKRISRLSSAASVMPVVNSESTYNHESITVLEGLDPVRKRPGMYIGSTGQKGLHHLVFEVLDNSVDEAMAGHCTTIKVELLEGNLVRITDNGRGIPCDLHPSTGKSTLETVLCVLHAGGKFGGESSGYSVSGGLHGVGLSVVNALSEELYITVVRDNQQHAMSFKRGLPQSLMSVSPQGSQQQRGTSVVFKPDPVIFKDTTVFDAEILARRFDELAYLNPGLSIDFSDLRSASCTRHSLPLPLPSEEVEEEEEGSDMPHSDESCASTNLKPLSLSSRIVYNNTRFRHEGGLAEWVDEMCRGKKNLHADLNVFKLSESRKGVAVEVALRWSEDSFSPEVISGFANNIRTYDGGSHVDGLKAAISKTINAFARKSGKIKEGGAGLSGEHIREGLTAVLSVKLSEPEFEGQTKSRLGNPEVRSVVDAIVSEGLTTLLDWNPVIANAIVCKALEASNAATAARAARDMVRRKSVLTNTVLPGKLSDCSSNNPIESEIYLVEGDSAAGSAKQGRNRFNQAILPLRGKIMNVEKAASAKIYQNKELQALISALGLGVRGAEFSVNQLRYHKIVIMTDADVDGAHIRLLLLTFLFRYQPKLITGGFVYVACPPLFKVTSRGTGAGSSAGRSQYLYDDADYERYIKELPAGSTVQTQRYKGLGEMMPSQLWDTTMDPTRRILKKVTAADVVATDSLFSALMGDDVGLRKDFISQRADYLSIRDLDF